MNTTLVKTLKGIPSGGNLIPFNAIIINVADNTAADQLQNINISCSNPLQYEIKDHAFSFLNRQGESLDIYSVNVNANSTLYSAGYEIPKNAVGTIIVKNVSNNNGISNVTGISAARGNFTIDIECLCDCNISGNLRLDNTTKIKINGDITYFYNNSVSVLSLMGYEDKLFGDISKYKDQYTELKFSNTYVSGKLSEYGKFTQLNYLWLDNTKVEGTVEELVAVFCDEGKTTGELRIRFYDSDITFDGNVLTQYDTILRWNGKTNITISNS